MKQFIFIISFLFGYYTAFPQTAEYYYEKSKQKHKEKQFLDALELIDKAIKTDTANNFWYHLHRSEINQSMNQYEEAYFDIQQAIKTKPDNSEPYNRLALLYSSSGQRDSALENYNRAMKYAKNDTIANGILVNRGTSHLRYMEWEPAIKDFEEVLKFNPDDIAALNNISTAYKKTNQIDKAILSLERILRIDSTNLGPYVNLGMIYTLTAEYEKAMGYFNKALEVDPDDALAWSNRGFLWYKMKNYDKAIVDINRSLTLYPTNSYAYKNRALAYFALEKIYEGCNDLAAAEYYEYSKFYGAEVSELKIKYCN